jgi:AGCS family alanine or glycine:cation symporter
MLAAFLLVGLMFTVKSRFFQIRRWRVWLLGTVKSIARGGGKSRDGASISQFQAMSTALAATVGTGNIAGVASAIALGGPGAVFWMWVSAFLGMMTGYAENALGIMFRRKDVKGRWAGGAMGYMERGLGARPLALLYAFFCAAAAFGIGNMTQVNSISSVLADSFRAPPLLTGIVCAALIGLVILGGLKRIASVTEKVVPLMVALYVTGALFCVFANLGAVPGAFRLILSQAFRGQSALGGAAGYGIARAVRLGISRGVFSNEAGLGSSVIVHSESDAKTPAQQGAWSMFEVFADTLVMCTLTALVILTSGVYDMGAYLKNIGAGLPVTEGAVLTSDAFAATLGAGGQYFIAVSITLFAFATLLGWGYYGERGAAYLLGERAVTPYKLIYVAVIVVGAVSKLSAVWDISDTFNGLMAVPNLIALVLLRKKAMEGIT